MRFPLLHPERIFPVVLVGLLAAAILGCDGYRSTTGPADPLTPSPAAAWFGSWFLDQATPAGDCLAEALNELSSDVAFSHFDLTFEEDVGHVRLGFTFWRNPHGDSEGFWPLEFAGTVGPDGAIRASVPAAWLGSQRTDPWGELCYWEWSMRGGELSATLSPDRRRLTGSIVESFRVETPAQDTFFTVHSHFTAEAP